MPIFHNLKLILIHVPKTGGTALTELLTKANDGKVLAPGHHGAQWYSTMYPIEWYTYTKVAVVRDPYDRFYSCYHYAKMLKSYWHSPDGSTEWGVHQDYPRLKDASPEQCCQYLLQGVLQHPTWVPQAHYLVGEGIHILRFESLADDFRKLNLIDIEDVPTINKTERPDDDIATMSPAVKAAIEKYYQCDLIFVSRLQKSREST